MIKRARPKRITLPNGKTFLARYRRATRDDLFSNVNLPRIYKEELLQKVKEEDKEQ